MSTPDAYTSIGPAPANLAQRDSVLTYGEFTRQLIADPTRSGEDIVDGFIGDLVAGDGVVTAELEHKNPVAVLNDIEAGVQLYRDARAAGLEPSHALGRSLSIHSPENGLQDAVTALTRDMPRSARLMPTIADRLKHGPDGITLTSGAQIYGFIDGITRRSDNPVEAEKWAGVLKVGLWRFATSDPQFTSPPWAQAKFHETSVQQERRNDFNRALAEARQAHLDTELLQRSAYEWRHKESYRTFRGGFGSLVRL